MYYMQGGREENCSCASSAATAPIGPISPRSATSTRSTRRPCATSPEGGDPPIGGTRWGVPHRGGRRPSKPQRNQRLPRRGLGAAPAQPTIPPPSPPSRINASRNIDEAAAARRARTL